MSTVVVIIDGWSPNLTWCSQRPSIYWQSWSQAREGLIWIYANIFIYIYIRLMIKKFKNSNLASFFALMAQHDTRHVFNILILFAMFSWWQRFIGKISDLLTVLNGMRLQTWIYIQFLKSCPTILVSLEHSSGNTWMAINIHNEYGRARCELAWAV